MDSKTKKDIFIANQHSLNESAPVVTPYMAKQVSAYRKDLLEQQVQNGVFRDGSASNNQNGLTRNGNVVTKIGTTKIAQIISGGGGYSGSGGTVKQISETYSPLWLNSNMSIPRDRITQNAWLRSFMALNPFVQNAIGLHSTYPISKLNIKCHNKVVEDFFNELIEELDLMNVCIQIAQEYWLLGEAFPYADWDESTNKWKSIVIHNPDHISVDPVPGGEPTISIRPDQRLKTIVFSNKPQHIEQRKRIPAYIIEAVKKDKLIPFENFNISHIARRISPYEIRGTGLPVSVFRQLMLFDKLRECYSEDTEVLTDKGFKLISELVYETNDINIKGEYVNGAYTNENNEISILAMKEDFKVACFNPNTSNIEYHKPQELHMSQYSGDMYNFSSRNYDIMVSPNHKMWVKKHVMKNGKKIWTEWHKIPASEMTKGLNHKFLGHTGWIGENLDFVDILGKQIPIDLFLKTTAYIISEGHVSSKQNVINLTQKIDSDCFEDMKNTFTEFASFFDKKIAERIVSTNDFKKYGFKKQPTDRWSANLYNKDLAIYFENLIGSDNKCKSQDKIVPNFIKNLSKEKLNLFLDAIIKGDGSHIQNRTSNSWKYFTSSQQLADDIQEIAFKCGWAPIIFSRQRVSKKNPGVNNLREFTVSWSNHTDGQEPMVDAGKAKIVKNNGIVWCFEVPTGLFVTRRNGKITIQGNSKFAQADNMINPLTLIKIGGEGNDGLHPTHMDLEHWRSVFECHDEETEVLTEDGFKKYHEIMNVSDIKKDANTYFSTIKDNVKIASFNPKSNKLEYHVPKATTLYDYNGEMYHFKNKKFDIKVTPNHDMFVSKRGANSKYNEYSKVKAKDLNINNYYKFKSTLDFDGLDIETVDVLGNKVSVKTYLEYLGYLLSEGSVYYSKSSRKYVTEICQSYTVKSNYQNQMQNCANDFAQAIGKKSYNVFRKNGMWSSSISNKKLYEYFKNEIGTNQSTLSREKHIPNWVKSLNKDLLTVLLNSLVMGDGSKYKTRISELDYTTYSTSSKQLANDIQEIVFKCGYAPILTTKERNDKLTEYVISWSCSESGKGKTPVLHFGNGSHELNPLEVTQYTGKVWCVNIENGLFVTRRNGKITIQGNSAQYDKDFKIFTHPGVTVEKIGSGSGIYDISGDVQQLVKEIFIGLQTPSVLMDGGSDTTYANGGVALDVLRQRYMTFRNILSSWLKTKIFYPVAKANGFLERRNGVSHVIIPEIDWNHMSLFDAGDYISQLVQLTTGEGDNKRASLHALYRSLGLEYEDEMRKIRRENIQSVIFQKEKESLNAMHLNELRSLTDDDEIPEVESEEGGGNAGESPLPGEGPPPGLDLGGPPPTTP